MVDALDIALRVAIALEQLGVAYFLGGSMASSLQGEPRATNDVDFVVELREDQIGQLAGLLGPDFEVDFEALRTAVRSRSSDNVFFLPWATKIDLFIAGPAPFDRSELARRHWVEVRPGIGLFVKSAEDSVLRKLLWFRAGGEASTQQWRDVVEILRVSADTLDMAYLASWAPQLGVSDLLARARTEVG
jgi:hypothetical protein